MTSSDFKIETIQDYFGYLAKLDTQDLLLFRGQRRDFPLLPKIGRLRTREDVRMAEKKMLTTLRQQALPLLGQKPADMWEWLAVAQHHGLATRLLDWTLNPLIALWFAVAEPPMENNEGVLWVFKPFERDIVDIAKEEPFALEQTKVVTPSHVTQRIRSQGGCFTIHNYVAGQGFIALDSQLAYSKCLTKLIIPPGSFSHLRFDLDRCGINQSSVYPDIDGLCRHIEWSHSFMEDELD